MIEGKSTLTLAEAMVMAREKSELGKRHARYKRYYDSHPGAMQKKNRDYYQEHRDTIRARCRLSSERRGLNTVTGFVHHHPIFDQNPGSSADRKCTMHDSGNTAWQCEHL